MYVTRSSSGNPSSGGVGFDESPVGLRLQVGQHLVKRAGQDVQPRRDSIQRPVEVRSLEYFQSADRLEPRRATFGGSANHDVVGAELELIPPG
jgi:hypothetical protein